MTRSPARPAIYVRVSRDTEGKGLGVERQQKECAALAKRLGWGAPTIYGDNDVSAYTGKRRADYERLLDDVKNGVVDGLLIWHPDRLHRSPRELEHFIDIVEVTATPIATVCAGEYDLTTASGRMTARIVGAVARGESEKKSERLRSKMQQMVEHGKPNGGVTVFGYRRENKGLVPDPRTAPMVRKAAAEVLAGKTITAVMNEWKRAKVPTVRGGEWTVGRVSGVLKNPALAGLRTHKGEVTGRGDWEAVIDESTYRRLAAFFSQQPGYRSKKSSTRLLTGVLYCNRCPNWLSGGMQRKGQPRYWCKHCGGSGVPLATTDAAVAQEVLAAIDSAAFAKAVRRITDSSDANVIAAIEEAEVELVDLTAAAKAGKVRTSLLIAASASIEARIAEARAQLVGRPDDPSALVGQGARLNRAWTAMTTAERRRIIQTVYERVVVLPGVRGSKKANTVEGALARLRFHPRYK